MIFGVAASAPQAAMAGSSVSSLMILAALSLAATIMVPIAASAALRAYMQ